MQPYSAQTTSTGVENKLLSDIDRIPSTLPAMYATKSPLGKQSVKSATTGADYVGPSGKSKLSRMSVPVDKRKEGENELLSDIDKIPSTLPAMYASTDPLSKLSMKSTPTRSDNVEPSDTSMLGRTSVPSGKRKGQTPTSNVTKVSQNSADYGNGSRFRSQQSQLPYEQYNSGLMSSSTQSNGSNSTVLKQRIDQSLNVLDSHIKLLQQDITEGYAESIYTFLNSLKSKITTLFVEDESYSKIEHMNENINTLYSSLDRLTTLLASRDAQSIQQIKYIISTTPVFIKLFDESTLSLYSPDEEVPIDILIKLKTKEQIDKHLAFFNRNHISLSQEKFKLKAERNRIQEQIKVIYNEYVSFTIDDEENIDTDTDTDTDYNDKEILHASASASASASAAAPSTYLARLFGRRPLARTASMSSLPDAKSQQVQDIQQVQNIQQLYDILNENEININENIGNIFKNRINIDYLRHATENLHDDKNFKEQTNVYNISSQKIIEIRRNYSTIIEEILKLKQQLTDNIIASDRQHAEIIDKEITGLIDSISSKTTSSPAQSTDIADDQLRSSIIARINEKRANSITYKTEYEKECGTLATYANALNNARVKLVSDLTHKINCYDFKYLRLEYISKIYQMKNKENLTQLYTAQLKRLSTLLPSTDSDGSDEKSSKHNLTHIKLYIQHKIASIKYNINRRKMLLTYLNYYMNHIQKDKAMLQSKIRQISDTIFHLGGDFNLINNISQNLNITKDYTNQMKIGGGNENLCNKLIFYSSNVFNSSRINYDSSILENTNISSYLKQFDLKNDQHKINHKNNFIQYYGNNFINHLMYYIKPNFIIPFYHIFMKDITKTFDIGNLNTLQDIYLNLFISSTFFNLSTKKIYRKSIAGDIDIEVSELFYKYKNIIHDQNRFYNVGSMIEFVIEGLQEINNITNFNKGYNYDVKVLNNYLFEMIIYTINDVNFQCYTSNHSKASWISTIYETIIDNYCTLVNNVKQQYNNSNLSINYFGFWPINSNKIKDINLDDNGNIILVLDIERTLITTVVNKIPEKNDNIDNELLYAHIINIFCLIISEHIANDPRYVLYNTKKYKGIQTEYNSYLLDYAKYKEYGDAYINQQTTLFSKDVNEFMSFKEFLIFKTHKVNDSTLDEFYALNDDRTNRQYIPDLYSIAYRKDDCADAYNIAKFLKEYTSDIRNLVLLPRSNEEMASEIQETVCQEYGYTITGDRLEIILFGEYPAAYLGGRTYHKFLDDNPPRPNGVNIHHGGFDNNEDEQYKFNNNHQQGGNDTYIADNNYLAFNSVLEQQDKNIPLVGVPPENKYNANEEMKKKYKFILRFAINLHKSFKIDENVIDKIFEFVNLKLITINEVEGFLFILILSGDFADIIENVDLNIYIDVRHYYKLVMCLCLYKTYTLLSTTANRYTNKPPDLSKLFNANRLIALKYLSELFSTRLGVIYREMATYFSFYNSTENGFDVRLGLPPGNEVRHDHQVLVGELGGARYSLNNYVLHYRPAMGGDVTESGLNNDRSYDETIIAGGEPGEFNYTPSIIITAPRLYPNASKLSYTQRLLESNLNFQGIHSSSIIKSSIIMQEIKKKYYMLTEDIYDADLCHTIVSRSPVISPPPNNMLDNIYYPFKGFTLYQGPLIDDPDTISLYSVIQKIINKDFNFNDFSALLHYINVTLTKYIEYDPNYIKYILSIYNPKSADYLLKLINWPLYIKNNVNYYYESFSEFVTANSSNVGDTAVPSNLQSFAKTNVSKFLEGLAEMMNNNKIFIKMINTQSMKYHPELGSNKLKQLKTTNTPVLISPRINMKVYNTAFKTAISNRWNTIFAATYNSMPFFMPMSAGGGQAGGATKSNLNELVEYYKTSTDNLLKLFASMNKTIDAASLTKIDVAHAKLKDAAKEFDELYNIIYDYAGNIRKKPDNTNTQIDLEIMNDFNKKVKTMSKHETKAFTIITKLQEILLFDPRMVLRT